jgi:hypothetical protein
MLWLLKTPINVPYPKFKASVIQAGRVDEAPEVSEETV